MAYSRLNGWGIALPPQLYPLSPWNNYPATGFYPNYQTQIAYGLLEGVVKINRPKNPGESRRWNLYLNMGLGTLTSQIKVDALKGGEQYRFEELGNVKFLTNKELKQGLYELWDREYETEIQAWKSSFSPIVSISPRVNFRAGRRISLQLAYRAMWTPDQKLDGGNWRQTPHFMHQINLGLIYRLGSRIENHWWSNPLSDVYSSAQEAREIVRRLTEDSDHDGVPDLYDKEPGTPEGVPVNGQGRSLDSDGDGIPDEEDPDGTPALWLPQNDSTSLEAYQARLKQVYQEYSRMASKEIKDASSAIAEIKLKDEMKRLQAEALALRDKLQYGASLRSTFRDYAYWQPNLITDANGKASFTATFPDDITGWETHVLAINENKQSGYTSGKIQSWKPLSGRLAVPSFVLQGDSASAIGRAISYGEDSLQVKSRFLVNEQTSLENDQAFLGSISEHLPFGFTDTGNYSLTYTIESPTGYQDGEKREIEVLPVGLVEKNGQFIYLDKDTSLTLSFDPQDGPVRLIAHANPLTQMLERLQYLKDYPYDCNEQAASKLIALISERQIRQSLGQEFDNERQIRKLVRRLQKSQNKDGSWGWWAGNEAHAWMTAHLSRALLMADPKNKSAFKGLEFLKDHIQESEIQPQIALHIWLRLAEAGIHHSELEEAFIQTLSPQKEKLPFYQQLMLTRIHQLSGQPYDASFLHSSYRKTALGGIYWGQSGWQWYGHQVEISLLAYQILKDKNSGDPLLPRIRQYFLEYPHYNTAELAQMLVVIVPDMVQAGIPPDLKPELSISYGDQKIQIDQFPGELEIPQAWGGLHDGGGALQHLGKGALQYLGKGALQCAPTAPVYLTAYQTRFIRNPQAVDSLFAIKTWLGDGTGALHDGRGALQCAPIDLWVELTAKKSADHLALEVPIPAGCVYGEKIQPLGEAHREYRKHMTTIFLEYLPEGTHRFRIPLEARYPGSYTLNPAKVEMMYVPVKFGRNGLTKVSVAH